MHALRTFTLWLLMGLCSLASAAVSSADRVLLNDIAQSMAAVRAMQADFVQTAADGSKTSGVFSMRRPGKARFAYNAPTTTRVISDGFWVVVEDTASQVQDRYPLQSTPLSLLFADKLSFESPKIKLEHVAHTNNGILVTMRLAKTPEQGSLTLIFTQQPNFELLGWTVRDAQDQITRVDISNVTYNPSLDNRLFYIDNNLRTNR